MTSRYRLAVGILAVVVLTSLAAYNLRNKPASAPQPSDGTGIEGDTEQTEGNLTVIAEGLDTPWEIAFLPDNSVAVTQRGGTLSIFKNGQRRDHQVPNVRQTAEGGLLGMALHPDFANNNLLYLYMTTQQAENFRNLVARFKLTDEGLSGREEILTGIPAGQIHNGGRLAFGPDGFLYITTGDAGQSNLSQDTNSLAGKILRVDQNGRPSPGNPFNNAVYAYGLRNPQGLDWDSQGRLWATDHGSSTQDEINRIEAGSNYGWPVIRGGQTREGMRSPILHSGSGTWAPAGLAILEDKIYFGGLRGTALYETDTSDNPQQPVALLDDSFGRIRALKARDKWLYFTTSNRDNRGNPVPQDDRLVRADPKTIR